MLDRKFVLENLDAVKRNCANRNVSVDLDRMVGLETERKRTLQEVQDLNTAANATSKSIGNAKDGSEREQLKEEGRRLREQKDVAQHAHDELEAQILAIQARIPNMAHPNSPIGNDDQANQEIGRGKHQPRHFDFKPLDHLTLGEKHGWIDFEGGARTTGNGFYFLMGELVLLDLAVQQYAVRELVKRGFKPAITPDLARDSVLEGIGFMPRGPASRNDTRRLAP